MSRIAFGSYTTPTTNNPPKVVPMTNNRPKVPPMTTNRPKPITVPIKSIPTNASIVGQVTKVASDVSELQKNLAMESAARTELQRCVEQLKVATEAKEHMVEGSSTSKRRSSGKGSLNRLMKTMPCRTLGELDWLLNFVENRSSQWIEYLKLLGGSDFSAAIKKIMNTITERSLLKQLSWTGHNTTKPSFQKKYKSIIDGIHVAMKESYKDYTIVHGEAKIQSILRNANKQ